jgi:hypothetical protein
MNGARFVHDRLEDNGWQVLICTTTKVTNRVAVAQMDVGVSACASR